MKEPISYTIKVAKIKTNRTLSRSFAVLVEVEDRDGEPSYVLFSKHFTNLAAFLNSHILNRRLMSNLRELFDLGILRGDNLWDS